jgi:hypothetical protein
MIALRTGAKLDAQLSEAFLSTKKVAMNVSVRAD